MHMYAQPIYIEKYPKSYFGNFKVTLFNNVDELW